MNIASPTQQNTWTKRPLTRKVTVHEHQRSLYKADPQLRRTMRAHHFGSAWAKSIEDNGGPTPQDRKVAQRLIDLLEDLLTT